MRAVAPSQERLVGARRGAVAGDSHPAKDFGNEGNVLARQVLEVGRRRSNDAVFPQQLEDVCEARVEQRLADAVDYGDAGAREQAFEEFHV